MSRSAWRQERDTPSLSEVFRTIAVGGGTTRFRRFLSFVGPGYLVAVGYMDPGNWATSLAGGMPSSGGPAGRDWDRGRIPARGRVLPGGEGPTGVGMEARALNSNACGHAVA